MENNNRQGCRWTKCKDKTPDHNAAYRQLWQNPYDEKHSEWMYFNGKVNEYDIVEDIDSSVIVDQDTVEWLDESIEPCATSSENYWKQRYDVEMDEQKLIEIFKRVSLWDLSECKFEYEKEDTGNHWCNAELNGRVIDSIIWDGNIFSMMNNNGTFSPLNPMLYYSPSPTGDRDCEELKERISELESLHEIERKHRGTNEGYF